MRLKLRFNKHLTQGAHTGAPLRYSPLSVIMVLTCVLLIACQPDATATPFTVVEASPGPKQLATVYMSPTPNQAEQEATRSANRPTATGAPPTPVPSATPYVGVFLGEAENAGDDALPIVDATLFANELVFELPTETTLNCPSQADPVFGVNWSADPTVTQALRCPTQPAITFRGTAQVFERGVMGVRDALGFARTDEQPTSFVMQAFEGGALLADGSSGQVFALVGAGTMYGPF